MPAQQTGIDPDEIGPIDYLAVEFPDGRITGEGFAVLLDLVDRHLVRILDLEFVSKTADGLIAIVDVDQLNAEAGVDLAPFRGASSGLLDQSDIDVVGAALRPGGVAAVLVHEELSTLAMVTAWRRSGARIITEGQLSADDVLSALDATQTS